MVSGYQNGRFYVTQSKVGKPTSESGEPRARLRKIFWYQDTGYPVHRCVCVSISPPHPTHPHPTPPQVAWWCDVRMCDLWWYGGEVADRIDNTLDRLEGSADMCICVACRVLDCPTHPTPPRLCGGVVAWFVMCGGRLPCGPPTRSTA